MDPFLNLPNETLFELCESMDPVTLAKFTESYSRAYQVCQQTLERKKKEFKRDILFQKIVEIVNDPDLDYIVIEWPVDPEDPELWASVEISKDKMYESQFYIHYEPSDLRPLPYIVNEIEKDKIVPTLEKLLRDVPFQYVQAEFKRGSKKPIIRIGDHEIEK